MSTPQPAFTIDDGEYSAIKAFVHAVWVKYPQYIKRLSDDLEYPRCTIEIEEDASAPIGSVCWFIKRHYRASIPLPMNQSAIVFKKEFEKIFTIFRLWS
jgi:hypothetical protein